VRVVADSTVTLDTAMAARESRHFAATDRFEVPGSRLGGGVAGVERAKRSVRRCNELLRYNRVDEQRVEASDRWKHSALKI
jgi:hypothetical protein